MRLTRARRVLLALAVTWGRLARGAEGIPPVVLEEQVIALCKENLSNFKVPRAVYFVDDFPRATLDKVAKNQLRDMADALPEPF